MDLATMRSEVQARGFSHVTTSLIDRWINVTYQDVNNRYPWPYLEATQAGVPPQTVTDLGHVLNVIDNIDRIPLKRRDIRELQEMDPALALTGNARFWYRDGTAGNQIKVWPVGANSITIRYTKIAPDLSTDGSIPLSPLAFHYILVEGACARAYRRANELEAAADAFGEVERGILKQHDLLIPLALADPEAGKPVAPNYTEPQTSEG